MSTTVTWRDPYSEEEEKRQAALRRIRQDEAKLEQLQAALDRYREAATVCRRFVAEYMAQSRNLPTLKKVKQGLEAQGVTKKSITAEQKQFIEQARGFDHLRYLADEAHMALQKTDKT